MAREMSPRKIMQPARNTYLGALLSDERRLVLVSMDPSDPWEAFKTMRQTMRRERKAAQADFSIVESPTPFEHQAEIIPLESRRRAG